MKEQRIPGLQPGSVRFHKEKPSRRLSRWQIDEKPVVEVPDQKGGMMLVCSWENEIYYGTVRKFETGSPFGGGPYAVIGIGARSEDALHDWRDFQAIKNHLVGREWEAVELYPAESRLVDNSNYYYLWCFPPGVLANLGLPNKDRHVEGPRDMRPAQRPFPEDTP